MTIEEIIESGELAGYKPGFPEGLAADIDSDVCRDSKCESCGHKGLNCRGFVSRESYRAFALCPICKNAEEF